MFPTVCGQKMGWESFSPLKKLYCHVSSSVVAREDNGERTTSQRVDSRATGSRGPMTWPLSSIGQIRALSVIIRHPQDRAHFCMWPAWIGIAKWVTTVCFYISLSEWKCLSRYAGLISLLYVWQRVCIWWTMESPRALSSKH